MKAVVVALAGVLLVTVWTVGTTSAYPNPLPAQPDDDDNGGSFYELRPYVPETMKRGSGGMPIAAPMWFHAGKRGGGPIAAPLWFHTSGRGKKATPVWFLRDSNGNPVKRDVEEVAENRAVDAILGRQ